MPSKISNYAFREIAARSLGQSVFSRVHLTEKHRLFFRILDVSPYVLVGPGEPALFECKVDASPIRPDTIRWERSGYDMEGKTKTTSGSPASGESDRANIGVVLLTVLNSTADDSGPFDCVAENGVGGAGTSVRNQTYLLVRRELLGMRKNLAVETILNSQLK